ncbi:MAG: UDP-N-acetyl-D-mannosamine dehydrogenase [Thermodesulfovibrio sp.]|nr:UDP-N-acetyl-D-mannosamine dehydrogenase [Thermodesulfovibrio sp.]
MKTTKKVCVIGLGYIGLPTAALLANRGFYVIGVDIDHKVVETVNRGDVHILEPELDIYVKSAINSKRLIAQTKPEQADVFIIAVPTPFKENYEPDISYVQSAVESIIPHISIGNIVVLESTSPVGTTEEIKRLISRKRPDLFDFDEHGGLKNAKIHIAYCPERVLPGRIMKELIENDRIVGGISQNSTKVVADFYRQFVDGLVLETDAKTAEMCKLVENAYRDVNIAFANELSMICDKLGINVWEVISLANHHPRVKILQPGPGVGGHCIAVDPWFIVYQGKELARLIKTAREVNLYKTEWVINKIKNAISKWKFDKPDMIPKIAIMGLSYKPDTDDLRESPALHIAKQLKYDGYTILAVEPNINNNSDSTGFKLYTYDDAIREGDIIVFLVAHKHFKNSISKLETVKEKIVLDFCGIIQQT